MNYRKRASDWINEHTGYLSIEQRVQIVQFAEWLDRLQTANAHHELTPIDARGHAVKSAPASWRCFHCDEVFTDPAKAKEHFGYSQYSKPACMINIEEYRRMERVHRAHCAEDTELHRQIHALQAEMAAKVRQAEEDGYRRGLTDGKSLCSCGIPARFCTADHGDGSMREGSTVRVPGVGEL